MNNILNVLLSNFSNNSNTQNNQNTYPNFTAPNNANNVLYSILPMLISGKTPDLTAFTNQNPLLSSILSTSFKKEPIKKIESDKIDVSSLSKI